MKLIYLLLTLLPVLAYSQDNTGWHHLDPEDDNVLGISNYKAYEFLRTKTADTVIVAVIDNGIELTHEDLQGTFWINPNEIKDNGIDDDKNGFIDDINGWNFIGNSDGKNLKLETTGLTRYYSLLSNKYHGKTEKDIDAEDLSDFKKYKEIKKEIEAEVNKKKEEIAYYTSILSYFIKCDEIITAYLKKTDYSEEEVRKIKKKKTKIVEAKDFLIQLYDNNLNKEGIEKRIKDLNQHLETRLNPEFKNRQEIVGDNPEDILDTIYGNNMLNVRGPYHGTGVASIVGASNNEIGIDGIAKHVMLMIIRIVPNGDERDKDIALAFRYAVKNGADIISCSFSKKYSEHYEFVQDAILETELAGVLIVHASGNNGSDNDEIPYFPTGIKKDGTIAKNWINVGASRSSDNKELAAFFSNYGKETVDIFAPGYDIRNCVLHNGYDKGSGTSISAPVVAGIAAVLKSYYPYLTAEQLKEIIMKSAYIPNTKRVNLPGQSKDILVDFKDLSVSGGIANLHRAVLLIEREYKN